MPPRYQHLWMIGLFALALFAIGFDEAAADEHGPVFDIYAFSVDVEAEVQNDLMRVRLAATAENADPAAVADEINRRMKAAVEQLADFPGIRAETLAYQTRPRYESDDTRRIIGWTATQTLQLETGDFELAGKALQVLQEDLQVQSMQLSARRSTWQAAEQDLIDDALQAFRQRAVQIQEAMGAKAYRVIELNVGNGGNPGAISRNLPMVMESRAYRSVETPAVEPGTARVTVRVDGRVQLQ